MDASSHEQHNSGSPWSLINLILAIGFGAFAFVSGASLIWSAFFIKNAPPAAASASSPAPAASAPAAAAAPAKPAASGDSNVIVIKPDTSNPLAYDTKAFTVKTGKKVSITFNNESALPQPHNMIICKPGTKDKVLALATTMLSDPQGMAKGYIPDSPDILAHTKLLMPKETQTLEFDAPAPGEYPYFCSFPGHALIMNGVMKVE
jgi:azurin